MKKLAGLFSAAALVFTVACGQTDSGITAAVKSKLAVDDVVKASDVDVTTQGGVVTLTGAVETMTAREQAVRLARDTDGVRDVIDNLRVSETAATSGIIDHDVDVEVDDDLEDNARKGANAVTEGARKGAEAVSDGAKKVGKGVRDAVTDDDRDSDNDGK